MSTPSKSVSINFHLRHLIKDEVIPINAVDKEEFEILFKKLRNDLELHEFKFPIIINPSKKDE